MIYINIDKPKELNNNEKIKRNNVMVNRRSGMFVVDNNGNIAFEENKKNTVTDYKKLLKDIKRSR